MPKAIFYLLKRDSNQSLQEGVGRTERFVGRYTRKPSVTVLALWGFGSSMPLAAGKRVF